MPKGEIRPHKVGELAVGDPSHYLCSFNPLCRNVAGRVAIARADLPPFIDGSCRREPDFQASSPSISALCRLTKFAPRLWPGDHVIYITKQALYAGSVGWGLVASLSVVERFESHSEAASWYARKGDAVPSNCLVPGNPPQPYHLTNQRLPKNVAARVGSNPDPLVAVRLWDATYAERARKCGVFLACKADVLELMHPRILRRSDFLGIFGRIPGTQNPPEITVDQYQELMNLAIRLRI
jgi:hypothetical protein